jgi:RimJ/RimL family protein N-acetyltransferase
MGIILETDRLILRTWALEEDADAAFKIWGDAEVMRFVGTPFEGIEVARRALGNALAAQEKYGFCLWAAVEKSSGKVIGCCGFHPYQNGSALELAYHFIPSSWGHGYAAEAAAACVRYGFEELGRSKIVAFTHPDNAASGRVLEKIRMRYKGLVPYEGTEEKLYELERAGEA